MFQANTTEKKTDERQYVSKQNGFITPPSVNIYCGFGAVHSTDGCYRSKDIQQNFRSTCQLHHRDTYRPCIQCYSDFLACASSYINKNAWIESHLLLNYRPKSLNFATVACFNKCTCSHTNAATAHQNTHQNSG